MRLIILVLYSLILFNNSIAQTEQSFTLKQAQEYALTHNYQRLNAEKDVLIAKKRFWKQQE